ncbi:MAG: hypothetical protein FJ088_06740 [Deltaproteobacteria bacterium]|nr:hypothetical protein [Deltaproteobacteria bacterium]
MEQYKKMIGNLEKGSKAPAETPFTPAVAMGQAASASKSGVAGKKATVTGTARNAMLGAVVVKDGGGPVYIDGLAEWDDNALGRRVEATGMLTQRKLAPDPVTGQDGGISHGMAGNADVLEDAVWKFL